MRILDIGCGTGFVARALGQFGVPVLSCDIRDMRRVRTNDFVICDAASLPYLPDRFDLTMFNFVLHHVPDPHKASTLREAMRVTRGRLFILEDTPANFLDRFMSRRHDEAFRRRAGTDASFGFFAERDWERFFDRLQLRLCAKERIGRFSRSFRQPFHRTLFVVEKER